MRAPAAFVPRVLVTGFDRGSVRDLTRALRAAGMAVLTRGPADGVALARAAAEAGADVIGLSLGEGDPRELCAGLRRELRAAGVPDLPIVASGPVPGSLWPDLADLGVRRVFVPGSSPAEVVRFIEWLLQPKFFAHA